MFAGQGRSAVDWEAAVREVFAASKYDWTDRTQPNILIRMIRDAARSGWQWLVGQLGPSAPAIIEVIKYLSMAIGVGLLLWGIWDLVRRLRGVGTTTVSRGGREQLRDATWYRRQAQALAEGGDYSDAVHSQFMALAMDLDDLRLLRFHPSKTPAEYATELSDGGHEAGSFRSLVRLLYGYCYAGRPCGREEFEAWRREADEVSSVARA